MSHDEECDLELLVHRTTWEADGVLSVELIRPSGEPLPVWTPGAHIDVHAGAHVRQYSLCSDPADAHRWRVAVLREPASRGGSAHVHDRLRPGQTLRVRGPRNHFTLDPDAERYLFVAGGIGITPLLAMAREAARRGVPWRLVHGGRRRDSMAFGEELRALELAAEHGAVDFVPEDECGRIDLDALLTGLAPGTQVYCCGPEPLLAAVEQRCDARTERFAAPAAAAPADPSADAAFEVLCRRSGATVAVPSGRSALDALEAAGVSVNSSCRDGICGTCETKVLDGDVDHRDYVLSDAEREAGASMMLCVSRARSARLVLDL